MAFTLVNGGVAFGGELLNKQASENINRGIVEECNWKLMAYPENVVFLTSRGLALGKLGKNKEALVDCRTAVRLKPNYAPAYIALAYTLGNEGLYEEAVAAASKAIELAPSQRAYRERGWSYSRLKMNNKAFEDFDKAIQCDPSDAKAFSFRGYLHGTLEEAQSAWNDFSRQITIIEDSISSKSTESYSCSDLARAYANRCIANSRLGKYAQGLSDATFALKLDQSDEIAYIASGWSHYKLNNFEKADRDFSAALRLDPDNWDAHYDRSSVRTKLGRLSEAMIDLNRAIALHPERRYLYNERALLKWRNVEYIESLQDFVKVWTFDVSNYLFNNLRLFRQFEQQCMRLVRLS